jgi:hypothetical protein
LDSHGRKIWIADAHRDDGKRFVVRADGIADCVSGIGLFLDESGSPDDSDFQV